MNAITNMYRILHYIPDLGRGGAETQLVENVRHMDSTRFHHIVCYGGPPTDYVTELQALGAPVFCVGTGRGLTSIGPALALSRIIQEHRVDLVHVGLFPSRFAFLAAAITRIPVITTLPNTFRFADVKGSEDLPILRRLKLRSIIAAQAWLARAVSVRFVAISRAVKDSAARDLGLPAHRIQVIYRGLAPEQFLDSPALNGDVERLKGELGLRSSHPVLLSVGRLVPQKGQRELLRAMPRILGDFPKARLLIVGEGPLRSELHQLREALGLNGCVEFLGRRTDVKALLQVSHLFLFSSFYEGLGNALVEASASGRAIVAFRIPAVDEVVEDGRSGILVRPRDVDEFARAVVHLAGHPELSRHMGRRGQELARAKFDIRENVRQLEMLYERVMADHARASHRRHREGRIKAVTRP